MFRLFYSVLGVCFWCKSFRHGFRLFPALAFSICSAITQTLANFSTVNKPQRFGRFFRPNIIIRVLCICLNPANENQKLKNALYLDNRIKECNKTLKAIQKNLVEYEDRLWQVQQGKTLKYYSGEIVTIESLEKPHSRNS